MQRERTETDICNHYLFNRIINNYFIFHGSHYKPFFDIEDRSKNASECVCVCVWGGGGGGDWEGNLGVIVVRISKPTPFIYPAFEKTDLFIDSIV